MKILTYLVHTFFWFVAGLLCLIVFFPLAIFPLIFWVVDMVSLGNYYTRRELKKQRKIQKKMLQEMQRASTQNQMGR